MSACVSCHEGVIARKSTTPCRVLFFSQDWKWSGNSFFDLGGCQFYVVKQFSALLAHLCAMKAYHAEKTHTADQEEAFRMVQKDRILLDHPDKAEIALSMFANPDGSFCQEILIIERNEGDQTFSVFIYKGLESPPPVAMTERTLLIAALEEKLGLTFSEAS